MSFAQKHKKGVIDWGIDTKDFEYFKLSDLYEMNGKDEVYVLKGVFINKNKPEKQLKEYGASPVGILEDKLINLPNHMLEEVEGILKDEEDITSIMNGEARFKIREYEKFSKKCYGIDWQEVEEAK
jgi:hypothetical protein